MAVFCFLLILNVFCFLFYSGFTTPKQLLDLTDEKLINIGIDALGHRKKIIKAITNTRKQVQSWVFPGVLTKLSYQILVLMVEAHRLCSFVGNKLGRSNLDEKLLYWMKYIEISILNFFLGQIFFYLFSGRSETLRNSNERDDAKKNFQFVKKSLQKIRSLEASPKNKKPGSLSKK